MTPQQIKIFMAKHQMGEKALANLLGVTHMAVFHWLNGNRTVSLTVVRILRLFDRQPELMQKFVEK